MPNGLAYGYGLFLDTLRGEPSIWHAGSMPGFSSLVRMPPHHRLGVVVMVNRDGFRLDRIAEEALSWRMAAAGAPFETAPHAPAERPVAMSLEELSRYEGGYENRWTMNLRVRDGALMLSRFGADLPVTSLGGGRFSVQAQGASRPDMFTITPASGDHPAFIQMFLWSFPRRSTDGLVGCGGQLVRPRAYRRCS